MSKDIYMLAHNELIEEYMEAHPGVSWTDAYDRTADQAYERMKEKIADMVDTARERAKYASL
jgi:hypothetical protein